jgi:nitrogen regulatory protein P-II 2
MTQAHLLTIIAEEVLVNTLEKEILQLGAKGYTVSKVTGRSQSALRDNPWDGENVRIEVITSEEVCLKIAQRLKEKYLEKYPMVTFFHPITVLRQQHFY